jgi:hypothetical protein
LSAQRVRWAVVYLPIDEASEQATVDTPLANGDPPYVAIIAEGEAHPDLVVPAPTDWANALLRIGFCPVFFTVADEGARLTGYARPSSTALLWISCQEKDLAPTGAYGLGDLVCRVATRGVCSKVLGNVVELGASPPFA